MLWLSAVLVAGRLIACQPDLPRGSKDALRESASRSAQPFALDAMMARLAPLHSRPHETRPGEWLAEHDEPGQSFVQFVATGATRIDAAHDARHTIHLQTLGALRPSERRIAELTADLLERVFGLSAVIDPDLDFDAPAAARRLVAGASAPQLFTGYLLDDVMRPRVPADAAAFVALTAADLWPGDGYDFVFGQASQGERVAVWSLHRFGDSAESPAAFRRALLRALKVAVHETGHLFAMKHCTAYECVMAGTNHLAETDEAPLWLCPECLAKLVWATGIAPRDHYQHLAEFCDEQGLAEQARFFRASAAALDKP
jgi:archaemetzincin